MKRARPHARTLRSALLLLPVVGCAGPLPNDAPRPADAPRLHHVGLNSVAPEAARDWYLRLWPAARSAEVAGMPAVAAAMYLVFARVETPPAGAFDAELGRPSQQTALWHIGAFVNTTDTDRLLAEIGASHLPLLIRPDDEVGVWRSGLTPYQGIRTGAQLADAEAAEPRPGGFSYVLAPDGVLFELTGGPNTIPSLSHVHLFHEEPQCAANWYVEHLGMTLPPVRREDGSTEERPPYIPCEAAPGAPGWPSLEPAGTIRSPRASVVHGNGSFSFYPRQCTEARCGADALLVPTRGTVLDHVAFLVEELDAWQAWLVAAGVAILEPPHAFGASRAFMIEGPDGLAIELVDEAGAPPLPE